MIPLVPKYNPDYFLINGLSDQQLEDSVELKFKNELRQLFSIGEHWLLHEQGDFSFFTRCTNCRQ